MQTDRGYVPLNQCSVCGLDFTGVEYFDQHRVGKHEYTFVEGLRMDPPREDGRRCLDEGELAGIGLVRVRPGDSRLHDTRVASGVPLYWDPAAVQGVRERWSQAERSTATI